MTSSVMPATSGYVNVLYMHCIVSTKFYGARFSYAILHASDLRYGVTDRHCSTTNSVGLAREHRLSGAHSCSPNSLVLIS